MLAGVFGRMIVGLAARGNLGSDAEAHGSPRAHLAESAYAAAVQTGRDQPQYGF
jgi:hypothetical protein